MSKQTDYAFRRGKDMVQKRLFYVFSHSKQGVLEPLLVRELEEQSYQVVIGARRLRAAKIAGLEAVPVRVVKLSDAEAIEAQVVENLQREDIHPLARGSLGFPITLGTQGRHLHRGQYRG